MRKHVPGQCPWPQEIQWQVSTSRAYVIDFIMLARHGTYTSWSTLMHRIFFGTSFPNLRSCEIENEEHFNLRDPLQSNRGSWDFYPEGHQASEDRAECFAPLHGYPLYSRNWHRKPSRWESTSQDNAHGPKKYNDKSQLQELTHITTIEFSLEHHFIIWDPVK